MKKALAVTLCATILWPFAGASGAMVPQDEEDLRECELRLILSGQDQDSENEIKDKTTDFMKCMLPLYEECGKKLKIKREKQGDETVFSVSNAKGDCGGAIPQ